MKNTKEGKKSGALAFMQIQFKLWMMIVIPVVIMSALVTLVFLRTYPIPI